MLDFFFLSLSFKAKYMNIPHFVCLFLCLWTVGLFPLIGNCEKGYYAHRYTNLRFKSLLSFGDISRNTCQSA